MSRDSERKRDLALTTSHQLFGIKRRTEQLVKRQKSTTNVF
jgi:hypothetical protein